MNVLCILAIYNEIDFLPYKVQWAEDNEFDIYVIDNYSTDFSYEWLKDHNIPCHRIDSNNSFDLRILHPDIVKTIDRIKPDWVVRNDADMFVFADGRLKNIIKKADQSNYNVIGFPMIDICNTGEKWANPFRTFFWYRHAINSIGWIYKWSPNIKYTADIIQIPGRREMFPPGVIMNYGRTKTKQERQELLRRRQRAWKNGLNPTSGRHYLREKKKNWKWHRSELKDIRKSEYWKYLKNYQ